MDSNLWYRGTRAGDFLEHPWHRERFRDIRLPLTKPSGLMQARLNLLAQELH